MKDFIKKLIKRWGIMERDEHYLKQCDLSGGKGDYYMNVFFDPIDMSEYAYIEQKMQCKLLPELVDLYKVCNGFMLGAESFRIFGMETNNGSGKYESQDLVDTNFFTNVQDMKPEYSNMIEFGYQSGWALCYDRTEMSTIYVIDEEIGETAKTFKDFDTMIDYYVDYFLGEYGDDGHKIHYDKQYEGRPLADLTIELI